jgi:hypothetical protein
MHEQDPWLLHDEDGKVTIHGPGGLVIDVGTSRPTWYTTVERLDARGGSLFGLRFDEGQYLDLWGERTGDRIRWGLHIGTNAFWPLPEAFAHALLAWAETQRQ